MSWARFSAAALTLIALPCAALAHDGDAAGRPAIGLFSTLPIYWGEADSLTELLAPGREAHWVRSEIEQDFDLVPLDVLDGQSAELTSLGMLIMAQPRALSAVENVALDAWVRGGGRLLLFADPLLTGESRYALGDPRRPHDIVLLSPILAHWGLRLDFDDAQEEGVQMVALGNSELPVVLAGTISRQDAPGEAAADCAFVADTVIAECTLGAGRVVIVADATVLLEAVPPEIGGPPLAELMSRAFDTGEIAGNARSRAVKPRESAEIPHLTEP